MQWFFDQFVNKSKPQKILDVGSYDVNGTYKDLINNNIFEYVGLDMAKGPNVDICPANTYSWNELRDNEFDIVISGQALEHIEFFWITVEEIVRVTKKGGLICIIAPNGFDEHRHPVDCWRFWTDGMIALARYFELELIHAHTNAAPHLNAPNWLSQNMADSMLVAKKNYSGKAKILKLDSYQCIPADHAKVIGNLQLEPNAWEKKEKKVVSGPTSDKLSSKDLLSDVSSEYNNWKSIYPVNDTLRPSRINRIAKICSAQNYLEVGIFAGKTFNGVNVETKVGVDPMPHSSLLDKSNINVMTSDTYFSKNHEKGVKFDIIYLDGLHTFEQTLRDFNNSLHYSHDKTIWLIDDTVPVNFASAMDSLGEANEFYSKSNHNHPRPWMGTVYRLIYFIHDYLPNYSYMTYQEHGQTVIYRKYRDNITPYLDNIIRLSSLSFEEFEYSKDAVMNFKDSTTIENVLVELFQ